MSDRGPAIQFVQIAARAVITLVNATLFVICLPLNGLCLVFSDMNDGTIAGVGLIGLIAFWIGWLLYSRNFRHYRVHGYWFPVFWTGCFSPIVAIAMFVPDTGMGM